MRQGSKRILRTGLIAGIAYAAWRAWRARVPAHSSSDIGWDTAPFPFPPVPRPGIAPSPRFEPFTLPEADGSCPKTHPVKAKLASGIYHVPGGGNYERTNPDRCYASAEAAEADGLRAAKR
jgi:hypothetical protein